MATQTTKRQTGSEIVKALEGVWREIVKRHPELPDVVMITGSGLDGMGAKWAHFWRERWTDKTDKSTRPELFIAGERLACGAKLTVQSMLHEAAHAIAGGEAAGNATAAPAGPGPDRGADQARRAVGGTGDDNGVCGGGVSPQR